MGRAEGGGPSAVSLTLALLWPEPVAAHNTRCLQVWAKEVNANFPAGTFSAAQYLAPGNLGSVTRRTLWCVNVFSFNASEACDQIQHIGSLPGQQAPGVVLELGNELYIGNQGDPRFPSSEVYGEAMREIVACARQHMP